MLIRCLIALTGCAAFAAAAFAASETAPAAAPAFYAPEKFESEPGELFYMFQDDGVWERGVFSAQKHGSADCVTPPSSLECSFPDVEGAAGYLELDLNQALPRQDDKAPIVPADAVGVAFYVKGDGSKGAGRIELRGEDNTAGPAFEFPLSDRTWHLVAVTWDKFEPKADPAKGAMLAFGLAVDAHRPAKYLVDALRFVKTEGEDRELSALAAAANAGKEPFDLAYRMAPGACAYNKGALAKSREKLHKGEPLKWLAYGDSVTVPVQLWNIPEKYRANYAYYNAAAATLSNEFHSEVDVTVNAVGGRHLYQKFDDLTSALDTVKPDVLIMHPWDKRSNYEIYIPKAVAKAREVGAEVVIVVPVYDAFELRDPDIDWLRQYAIDNNIACADARTYLLGPGKIYWGGYFANPMHPCPEGHRLMGQVLAEMFR
jgi:hypothetical protein